MLGPDPMYYNGKLIPVNPLMIDDPVTALLKRWSTTVIFLHHWHIISHRTSFAYFR
jgi:hypothetical protein